MHLVVNFCDGLKVVILVFEAGAVNPDFLG